ncbi:MAG: RluA family pseudouridine synthase [Phycisphaeraceae bacterium]|nr:RluA family pseudouridine synthase [Phycisphaeraceae bacterium]
MTAPSTAGDGYTLLHADQALIVLDKAAGLLSVPGIGPEKADCLVARAAQRYPGARIVHRLDRDTSGVIVLALDAETHRALSMQFQERRTSKRYEAIVAGSPEGDSGEVDLPIRKNLDDPPRQMVCHTHGRPSLTRWRVLERLTSLPALATPGASELPASRSGARLELEPITGRGHQLRLHLLWIGLPIVGDDLYAPAELRPPGLRMLLHARELAFNHPVTGERVSFTASTPF